MMGYGGLVFHMLIKTWRNVKFGVAIPIPAPSSGLKGHPSTTSCLNLLNTCKMKTDSTPAPMAFIRPM